ncbi:hypothetical protein C8R46DRAFT_667940 [Mycena filopes]|nr:hypothetical protein C8R46DRAFT_667940 [Mycena filopes]
MWPSLYLAFLLSTQLQVLASSGAQSPVDVLRDSELLDIVLVASVDGDFHVLNRSTGHVQRSRWLELLSDDVTSAVHGQVPAFTAPLVPLVDTGCADSAGEEIYIIEPQSGAIYTMPAIGGSGSPLQRFPFSVPELVEMSPFSFNPTDSATGNKIFVGRKETRVLGVDTQTGKVRSVTDEEAGTIHAQANDGFWSAQEVLDANPEQKTRKLTEVFVGRTDYHVTIHAGPSNKISQTLSFSMYGPDQHDNILQVEYTDTKDHKYMQSAPNGAVLAFDSAGRGFGGSIFMKSPIVAIFDVLRKPDQDRPFVLLQPRAPSSALGTFMDSANLTKVPFVGLAYVGIVEEPETPTGSLFAMTPDVFPLGAKHGGGRRRRKPKRTRLVPRPGGGLLQVAEEEPEEDSDEPRCGELEMGQTFADRRCLVGMHPLEGTDGTTMGGTPGASDE